MYKGFRIVVYKIRNKESSRPAIFISFLIDKHADNLPGHRFPEFF